MTDTDEIGIDMQSTVEVFTEEVFGAAIPRSSGVLENRRKRVLPLSKAGKEGNVLSREFTKRRKLLERGWVTLQNVLESAHGQNTVARASGLDGGVGGFPS